MYLHICRYIYIYIYTYIEKATPSAADLKDLSNGCLDAWMLGCLSFCLPGARFVTNLSQKVGIELQPVATGPEGWHRVAACCNRVDPL